MSHGSKVKKFARSFTNFGAYGVRGSLHSVEVPEGIIMSEERKSQKRGTAYRQATRKKARQAKASTSTECDV